MNYSPKLQGKIISYYEKCYQNYGLADYKERAKLRLTEESVEEKRTISLQEILGQKFTKEQKHFIFGAGTGGLAVALFKEYNCEVYGIEPDSKALEIIREKCREAKINPDN